MAARSAPVVILCAILCLSFLAAGTALAQDKPNDERSLISKSEIAINWMKTALRSQSQDLEAARRAKDTKTINCIEDRIVEIQAAITDSEKALERLKDYAFRKALDQARAEYDRIERNRKRVEELLELIKSCREQIASGKSFTEVTEEFSGNAPSEDPTAGEPGSDSPAPLPPTFDSDKEPPTQDEPEEVSGDDDTAG
ncbi:MAG: hypothetical protein P9M14_17910 [Candidatus Alcyoniella australis]|nr:hypothetical protein [Candidatus Alcyoniella australis]